MLPAKCKYKGTTTPCECSGSKVTLKLAELFQYYIKYVNIKGRPPPINAVENQFKLKLGRIIQIIQCIVGQ